MLCERNPSIHLVARVALTQPLRHLHPLTDWILLQGLSRMPRPHRWRSGIRCGIWFRMGERSVRSSSPFIPPGTPQSPLAAAAANADYVSVTTGKTEMSGGYTTPANAKRQTLRLLTLMEHFRVHPRNEMTFSCPHGP